MYHLIIESLGDARDHITPYRVNSLHFAVKLETAGRNLQLRFSLHTPAELGLNCHIRWADLTDVRGIGSRYDQMSCLRAFAGPLTCLWLFPCVLPQQSCLR